MPKELNGGKGYRGRGWQTARARVLKRDRYRSTTTGLRPGQATLSIDHIHPYRLGGTNAMTNLRTTDTTTNPHTDVMNTASERKPKRRMRRF